MASPFNTMAPVGLWPSPGSGGGGTPTTDRFAPRIVVGNEPAGDPATAQAAPFQYIADPGDGSGIAAALVALAAEPGWIHIRRGDYDLSSGAVADFQVPSGVTITGDGRGTTILGRTAGNQRIFRFLGDGLLHNLVIDVPQGDVGTTGSEVILVDGDVDIENVIVSFDGDVDSDIRYALRVSAGGVATLRQWSSATTSTLGGGTPGIAHLYAVGGVSEGSPFGAIRGCDIATSGGDVVLYAGGQIHVARVFSTGWRAGFVVAESAVPTVDVLVHDARARSSGAAYGGVAGILCESPSAGAVVEVSSAVIENAAALPAGFDVSWAAGVATGAAVSGPTLRDVVFNGFNSAVYGGAGGDPISGCYHSNVVFSRGVNSDFLTIADATSDFDWADVDVYVLWDAGGGGTAAVISGDDHQFTNCRFTCETTNPGDFGRGLVLGAGTGILVQGGSARAQGTGATSRVLLVQNIGARILGMALAPLASLGGPAVVLEGGQAIFKGCRVDVGLFSSIGVSVTSAENIVSGNVIVSSVNATAAISVSANNNNITNNINKDAAGVGVDGVVNTGANNEVFGNIAT